MIHQELAGIEDTFFGLLDLEQRVVLEARCLVLDFAGFGVTVQGIDLVLSAVALFH